MVVVVVVVEVLMVVVVLVTVEVGMASGDCYCGSAIDKSQKHGSVWLVSFVYHLPVCVVGGGGSASGGDGSSGGSGDGGFRGGCGNYNNVNAIDKSQTNISVWFVALVYYRLVGGSLTVGCGDSSRIPNIAQL